MSEERKQAGLNADWWATTAIHEAAHGMAAFALGCYPLELTLNRRLRPGDTQAGCCRGTYERTWYGDVAKIYVTNAPFCAHQHECLPSGDKGDLHERAGAYRDFNKLIGTVDETLFRKCVDEPLIAFFANTDIQAATLALASQLYASNHVSVKSANHWRNKFKIPETPCETLVECCFSVARAIAGE